eukprot:CAMPEP_0117454036 /NCGR_PEP_ID=MMETSP0759-20121206/10576_1 /TAXON_ID=63605 /ORGANISM="Percolomonas cosmopolitus, Strain WS" /LENGTH=478 /DNA_ID=CAMNT_0005247175 /DNA_START=28 /DNA_END=1464 /DNA_ORIENTATION=+
MSFSFGNTSNTGPSSGFNFGGASGNTTGQSSSGGGGFNFGNAGNTSQSTTVSTGGTSGGFNFGNTSGGAGNAGSSGGSTGFNFGNTGNAPQSTSTTTGGTSGGFNFGNTSGGTGNAGSSGGSTGFNFGNTGNTSTGGTSSGFNFGNTSSTGGSTGNAFNFSSGGNTSTGGTSTGFNFGNSSNTGGTTGSAFNFSSGGNNSTGFNLGTGNTTVGGNSGGTMWQVQNTQLQLVESEIQKVHRAYNAASPQCRFMFWLYNAADPSQKPLLEQKIIEQYKNVIHPRQFQEARNGNPDNRRFYAVPVRSFDDLTQRVEKQNERTEQFKLMLQSLEKRIEALRRHHEVTTVSGIEQVKLNYRKLYSRVLRLMSMMEILHQRGVGVGSSDIALKSKLQALQRELQKPNQYRGRLNELVPQVNYYIQNSSTLHAPPLSEDMMDEDTEKQIKDFFEEQTRGLKQLLKILNKDVEDVNLIRGKLQSYQ